MTQDVAEGVLGAAKDGNVKLLIVKVLILPIAICQRCSFHRPPRSRGRHVKNGHVKDAAEGVAEGVP